MTCLNKPSSLLNIILLILIMNRRVFRGLSKQRTAELVVTRIGQENLWPGLLGAPIIFAAALSLADGVGSSVTKLIILVRVHPVGFINHIRPFSFAGSLLKELVWVPPVLVENWLTLSCVAIVTVWLSLPKGGPLRVLAWGVLVVNAMTMFITIKFYSIVFGVVLEEENWDRFARYAILFQVIMFLISYLCAAALAAFALARLRSEKNWIKLVDWAASA